MPKSCLRLGFAIWVAGAALALSQPISGWTKGELAVLKDLWIGTLGPVRPDPSNAFADDPRAVAIGHKLFFDTRFSANGKVSCAACHKPELGFQDGLPLAKGIGTANRRTMIIVGAAYGPWFFWDGRKDSQWAQALAPMENPVEHGANRGLYAGLMARHYARDYAEIFGPMPDISDRRRFPASAGPVLDPAARSAWERMAAKDRDIISRIFANMGKAIAAYGRKIAPGPARFDRFVKALLAGDERGAAAALTPDETAGLKIFIGKGECTRCHNGPLLTDHDFHNTGVPAGRGLPPDYGRLAGVKAALADEFNCLSPYSDAERQDCGELLYAKKNGDALLQAFKTPTLRNAAERAPYMHAGQFASLTAVLVHYNLAPPAPAGRSELKPLSLSAKELGQLEAFIRTLSGPLNTSPEFLKNPHAEPDAAREKPRPSPLGARPAGL